MDLLATSIFGCFLCNVSFPKIFFFICACPFLLKEFTGHLSTVIRAIVYTYRGPFICDGFSGDGDRHDRVVFKVQESGSNPPELSALFTRESSRSPPARQVRVHKGER